MNSIKTLTIILMTIGSVISFKLGYDWMTIGRGINPMISFPSSTLILVAAFVLPKVR